MVKSKVKQTLLVAIKSECYDHCLYLEEITKDMYTCQKVAVYIRKLENKTPRLSKAETKPQTDPRTGTK